MRKNFFLIIFYMFVTVTSVFGKSSDKLLEEAGILREKGFPDSATAIYRQILESEPDNIQAITDFAEEMLEIRNYAYALTLYRRYLELKPDDVQVRTLVIDLYMSLELYESGADECLNVLRKNPDDLIFLRKLKNIYQKANLLKKEMAVTEKISSLEPDNEEIKKRLLELYIMQGRYDKSVELVDKISDNTALKGYVYRQGNQFDKAIETFKDIYVQTPSEDNRYSLLEAQLSEINYNLATAPGVSYGYYNPMSYLRQNNPQDIESLWNVMKEKVSGLYGGFEYRTGDSGINDYTNYYGYIDYPVLPSGTELILKGQRYEVSNDNLSSIYRQFGLEVRQPLGSHVILTGGFSDGIPDNTYYGQFFFQSKRLQAGIRRRKDCITETPEALAGKITFKGTDYYINIFPTGKLNLFTRISNYDFSDSNNGTYTEVGGFYRIWENNENMWFTAGITRSSEKFDFQSPLYYSPSDISQWNYTVEWDCYVTDDSLLHLGYTRSYDSNDVTFNFYSISIDNKCSDNIYVYGQYLNGANQINRIGYTNNNNQNNYEFTAGLKCKF